MSASSAESSAERRRGTVELRRQADHFIDLASLQRFVERSGGGPRMQRPMADDGPGDRGDGPYEYDDEDEDAYN